MKELLERYLRSDELAPALPEDEAARLAEAWLNRLSGLRAYPASLAAAGRRLFFLGRRGSGKRMAVLAETPEAVSGFEGDLTLVDADGWKLYLAVGPLSPSNAAAMRQALPFLTPRVLGLKKAAGCGDRLGLATPGHVRAIRPTGLAFIPAQQSVRENDRTGRSPQTVLDEAMWGLFQVGWREGYGADADHLKTTADLDTFAAAGYTFFTVDPGDHLDNQADRDGPDRLRSKYEALPWPELETTPADLERATLAKPFNLDGLSLALSSTDLLRAAAKYGRVVAHSVRMYRHLFKIMSGRPFELEVSVDETESVTTLAEHVYLAVELKRLGVNWVSLAPRYLGRFEKGVDYIGDIEAFERYLAGHAAVARALGPYKLSIHSGSDKLAAYPIFSRLAGELVHLKTAGTSYLVALKTIGAMNPDLFRDIYAFAVERYPQDRATYHVSAETAKAPDCLKLPDSALPGLLDDFHARQILHVTYGSVLARQNLKEALYQTLRANEDTYSDFLEEHFRKHFELLV
ncbi:MAG: tagaturonate epimerase family protein [Thermodesulfobacteriota bacterium]